VLLEITTTAKEIGSDPLHSDRVALKPDQHARFRGIEVHRHKSPPRVILVRIDGITVDPRATAHVRVFVNLPQGQEPTVKSPHYIGYFTVVAKVPKGDDRRAMPAHGMKPHPPRNVAFDVTRKLSMLLKDHRHFSVSLVPFDLKGRRERIKVGFSKVHLIEMTRPVA
jgi:hypothetical protein